ncbi:hypothetical protein PIB30_087019 [Stylosanthes scabra]|uniref:Uncharacterized protein n=1 Tax=Stylosanthes scabra TaxID=79078 RepID=A0ABU6RU88_9FABA|nr:hypothetical protein [Stylosanthes scabra]
MDPCALPMPPRLSQIPEEHWFDNDNERLMNDERLSKMEILPPKFIGDGVLPDEKYPEFWRLIAHSSTCVRKISHAISSKNIHQMWRNLVGQANIAEDAGVVAMAGAQPRVETDAPSQIPAETEVPPRFQPGIAEFVRKGFEDMRSMMTEGFARLSYRIDRLDLHMARQDADLRNLREEFCSFHGENMYIDVQE